MCKELKSLDVKGLPDLRTLDLSGCEKLDRLDMGSLPALHTFDLTGCKNLKNVKGKDELPNLKILG